MEFFDKLWRYKDICCEVTGEDEEPMFMMNDRRGTVVAESDLVAVQDEDYMKDLKAAKSNVLDYIFIVDPDSNEITMTSLSEAYEQNSRLN